MVRRLMYVNPSDRAPASCVPFGTNLLGCWERRCCRFLVTLVLTMLKARYMELLDRSFDSEACTTESAVEVGYRNLAMLGVEAMKLAVF